MARYAKVPIALTALAGLGAALAGCVGPAIGTQPSTWATVGTALMRDAGGNQVGTAELRRRGTEWALAIGISGQTPGEHGIHLHAVGQCTGPDFASAKGHLNPSGKAHGTANPAGAHMGDLPNLVAGPDGTASVVLPIPSDLEMTALFDSDGTALVVHAGPDDYRTDPAGNSGGRIACGTFSPVPE